MKTSLALSLISTHSLIHPPTSRILSFTLTLTLTRTHAHTHTHTHAHCLSLFPSHGYNFLSSILSDFRNHAILNFCNLTGRKTHPTPFLLFGQIKNVEKKNMIKAEQSKFEVTSGLQLSFKQKKLLYFVQAFKFVSSSMWAGLKTVVQWYLQNFVIDREYWDWNRFIWSQTAIVKK